MRPADSSGRLRGDGTTLSRRGGGRIETLHAIELSEDLARCAGGRFGRALNVRIVHARIVHTRMGAGANPDYPTLASVRAPADERSFGFRMEDVGVPVGGVRGHGQ